mmetsp:Transcript_34755/g.109754  ORF Transcript_34755/g.109754 Transcript_34755/m.109754 type:complete len:146 (-) Transcript_34755:30-467(-)
MVPPSPPNCPLQDSSTSSVIFKKIKDTPSNKNDENRSKRLQNFKKASVGALAIASMGAGARNSGKRMLLDPATLQGPVEVGALGPVAMPTSPMSGSFLPVGGGVCVQCKLKPGEEPLGCPGGHWACKSCHWGLNMCPACRVEVLR